VPANRPNFLIVGAPKAGTTSLYRYLQQHPAVFMPENKEPRFFCNYPVETFEFGKKQFHPDIVSTAAEYASLFAEAPPGSVSGEASTDYLSCSRAAQSIHSWNPSMKIVMMLRNPIDRAYSEYMHSFTARFQRNTFWESLCLEEERINERYDPIFWHVRRGLYFERVAEYIQLFGRKNVRVILFEEFAKSTDVVVKATFEFLGIPDFPVDVAERYNVGRERPLGALRRFAKWLPQGRQASPREVLTPTQYAWLEGQFRQDILRLQELLNVDLSHWH